LLGRENFKGSFDYWWNRSFNIKKVSTGNRTFTYYIQTDGISVSVHLQKPEKIDEMDDDNDGDYKKIKFGRM